MECSLSTPIPSPSRRTWIVVATLAAGALGSCKRGEDARARPILSEAPRPAHASSARLHERSGLGVVAYLGFDVRPASPAPGEIAELTHYFQVQREVLGDYDVFVHADAPGGARVIVADHAPAEGLFLTSRWRRGEIWVDKHRIQIPRDVPSSALEIFVGLFKGGTRLTVEAPPGGSDGQDRVRAGVIRLGGDGAAKDDLPEVLVPRASGRIVADGILDEADWAKATALAFADSMGRNVEVRFPTALRLLYDDTNLYVAFEAKDADITDRYAKRDDPIYEHEAVELFLMPNAIAPASGPYVELQASPSGVIFDASFTGRRQGMDVGWNAAQVVATKVDGTLNVPGDVDRGWVSEWIVPIASVRGASPPKPGDEWRANAFRIEKFAVGSEWHGEYTAWSPPRVGDFHNVARFGRMKFTL